MSADPLIQLADRNVANLLGLLGLEPAPASGRTANRPTSCAWCGAPIAVADTGRPRAVLLGRSSPPRVARRPSLTRRRVGWSFGLPRMGERGSLRP